eukprot:scaffold52790_cov15-Prasinocladus_malaysianus.AAC.2
MHIIGREIKEAVCHTCICTHTYKCACKFAGLLWGIPGKLQQRPAQCRPQTIFNKHHEVPGDYPAA